MILKKKIEKVEGLILSDFKTYYKTIIIQKCDIGKRVDLDLNIKLRTVKLLEENMRENIWNLVLLTS